MLSALDAMRASKLHPSINLKFFFEGEEEKDSPHLRAYLEHNRVQIGPSHAASPKVGRATGSLDWTREMVASASA